MKKSVEQIEAGLLRAAQRAESRALARLGRLVQPAARSRAGAELGRARAAMGRAAAQAERLAQQQADQAARTAQRQADQAARAGGLTARQIGARKAAATRAQHAAQRVDAHNRQRRLNRDQGFAPPPPLAPPPPAKRAPGRWFRDTFPVGGKIFRDSYTVAAVDRVSPTAAVLTMTRADGQTFYIGAVKGPDGKPRFTARQLTYDDAEADVEALDDDYNESDA